MPGGKSWKSKKGLTSSASMWPVEGALRPSSKPWRGTESATPGGSSQPVVARPERDPRRPASDALFERPALTSEPEAGPAAEPPVDPLRRAADGTLWLGPWAFDELPLRLRIDPPLALGLRLQQLTSGEPVPSGDALSEFDAWHSARADDVPRGAAFLHPALRKELVALRPTYHVVLDDEALVLRWREGSPESQLGMRAAYARLAPAIELGRAIAPPDAKAALLVSAWEKLSKKRGLTLWHAPLGAGGRVGETWVRAGVWPRGRGWSFRFSLRRETPMSLGLSVARAGIRERMSAPLRKGAKADRDVGAASFDEAFDVRTTSPELLSAILDAPARAAVLACAAIVPELRLHDHGAEGEARGATSWAADLPRFVDDAIDLVELLARNAAMGGAPAAQGPYR